MFDSEKSKVYRTMIRVFTDVVYFFLRSRKASILYARMPARG